ncbi:MAG: hypothetical protein Q9227_002247, partial [Pyrenula ochraceoflavens]
MGFASRTLPSPGPTPKRHTFPNIPPCKPSTITHTTVPPRPSTSPLVTQNSSTSTLTSALLSAIQQADHPLDTWTRTHSPHEAFFSCGITRLDTPRKRQRRMARTLDDILQSFNANSVDLTIEHTAMNSSMKTRSRRRPEQRRVGFEKKDKAKS